MIMAPWPCRFSKPSVRTRAEAFSSSRARNAAKRPSSGVRVGFATTVFVPSRSCSFSFSATNDIDDCSDGLLERVALGPDEGRVVRNAQRRGLARAVDAVAAAQIVLYLCHCARVIGHASLLCPAPRALLDRHVEVELEVRVREHDRADIASGHDDPARPGERTLYAQQRRANRRVLRDAADFAINLCRVQAARDVPACDDEVHVPSVLVGLKRDLLDERHERIPSVEVGATLHGQPRQTAVQDTRVTEAVAELRSRAHADRRFAAAARAIDAHDQAVAHPALPGRRGGRRSLIESESSCRFSTADSSRTSPRRMPYSRSVPKRMRTSRLTETPAAKNIRRIWRFMPCSSVTRYQVSSRTGRPIRSPIWRTSAEVAGRRFTRRALPSSRSTPRSSVARCSASSGRSMPTAYSRSTSWLGWSMRCAQSPSFVSSSSPSESRSSRPTGNNRWARAFSSPGTRSTTVLDACRSLTVLVTPAGFASAR